MKLSENVFLGCDFTFEEARIVMFGAPFDSTTSFRPGTRFAGRALRADSDGIENYSPYQNKSISDLRVTDCGDLELPFGDTTRALDIVKNTVSDILEADKKPFMIGGEHLVTLGAVRAVAEKYPDLHIIHFDAHADLREDYLGVKLSHAAVMRRIWEITGDGRIFQYGIRSGEREEFDFANKHTIMHKYDIDIPQEHINMLRGKPVYLSLDLDVLDPAFFPGTGTPEPGGVTFKELLNGILLLEKLDIVACDVCELSPHYDHSGISTAAACKAVRELLMIM